MTVTVLSDSYTDTANTPLSSHTAESGGTYALWSGSHIPVVNASGRVARSASATTTWGFAIHSATYTYDGEKLAAVVTRAGATTSWACLGLRGNNTSGGNGYWVRISTTAVEFWRTNNGGSVQLTPLSTTISCPTDGDYNFELRVSNSVDLATVTLEVWLGGSLVASRTDTSGSRITARGSPIVGAYNNADFAVTSVTATNDDPPITDGLTFTYPLGSVGTPQQRTRGAMTGPLRAVGTYTGTPTSIEARVVQTGTNTPVSGFDWATYVASPSGGAFDFTIPGVPVALAWYDIQVRFSNNTGVTATSGKTTLAAIFPLVGQSNARFAIDTYGSSTLTPNDFCRAYGLGVGGGAAWTALDPTKMDGPITLANDYGTRGVPVAFVSCGVGGTAIATWNPGQSQYITAMANITATGGKAEAMIWVQGEADVDALSAATYQAELGDVFDTGFRATMSDTNLPVVLVMLGYQNIGLNTDAGMEAIRAGQAAWCAAAPAKNLRVERYDLTSASGHMADDVHLNAAGHRALWPRIARAARVGSGEVSTYRGPRIAGVSFVNSTTVDVTLTHDYGTDITAGAVGPWRVTNTGTPITVSTVTRQSATVARLGLAATVTSPVVGNGFGKIVTGTPLRDNSALALPLEWDGGTLVGILGQLSTTLSPISFSATGELTPLPTINGTLAVTLSPIAFAAAATMGGLGTINGALSVTLQPITFSAAGVLGAVPSPSSEPVTLAEAKLAARLNVDETELDPAVLGYISTARQMAEHETGREYVAKTKRYTFTDWPAADHVMHVHQPTAVAVQHWDGAGWVTLTNGTGFAWGEVDQGVGIAPPLGQAWPALGAIAIGPRVRVDVTAGSATPTTTTPECVKTFIKAAVAFWVDNPTEGASGSLSEAPRLGRLLDPERLWGA